MSVVLTIADFITFVVEAFALLIALTVATYLLTRVATAAYFNSQFEFLARLSNQVKWSKDGTEI